MLFLALGAEINASVDRISFLTAQIWLHNCTNTLRISDG